MEEIKCKKCGENMKNLGNISGIIYTSYPAQWDSVYVCESCKEKQTVREHGELPPNYSYVNEYPEQSNVLPTNLKRI